MAQKPVARPLCILDSKLDTSSQPPTRLVLVQWEGQPLEDTTWETWSEIRDLHHLEDKVHFTGEGIDSLHDSKANTANSVTLEHAEARPKRTNSKPSYLKDYVL